MKRSERVSEIMSQDVVTLRLEDRLSEIRGTMIEHHIHHLPVVDGGRLVGMLSWSDLLRVSFGDVIGQDPESADKLLDHVSSVAETMSRDLVTLAPDDTIRHAASLLAEGRFHALPVVDDGRVVGMLSSTDLVRYLYKQYWA